VALPKRKKSKSRRNMRRSHDALQPPSLATCPQCKKPMVPHRVCLNCGYYRGRAVLPVEEE